LRGFVGGRSSSHPTVLGQETEAHAVLLHAVAVEVGALEIGWVGKRSTLGSRHDVVEHRSIQCRRPCGSVHWITTDAALPTVTLEDGVAQ